jgi:hypothetical protein
MALRRR